MIKNEKLAFSLIELSIVVLLIGILIAGVTQGSRLIRQSKIKTAQNLTKNSTNVTQAMSLNQPQYEVNGLNNLPSVIFSNSPAMVSIGSAPYNNYFFDGSISKVMFFNRMIK